MTARILCTMALEGVLTELGIGAEFQPTARLLGRIRGGERADLAILTAEGIDALIAEGVLEAPRRDLARSSIGVAVKAGAPHPDIATEAAFVQTLLEADGIAMSEAGASGLYMAEVLERLGIAAQIRPKATILTSGFTASLVANGTVALAIQQVSELMMVPGVDIVGRIPASLGGDSVFAVAAFRGGDAAALVTELSGRAALFDARGLVALV